MRIGIFLAALLACGSAMAAEGESFPRPPADGALLLAYLGTSDNRVHTFVEITSASGERNALVTWLLEIHHPPTETPTVSVAARWTRWTYDCDAASGEPNSDVYLGLSYELFGGVIPAPGVIAIPEGTIGQLALDAICDADFPYPDVLVSNVADAAEVVNLIVDATP